MKKIQKKVTSILNVTLIILLSFMLSLTGCKINEDDNPSVESGKSDIRLSYDGSNYDNGDTLDLGSLAVNEEHEVTIEVVNVGNGNLVFKEGPQVISHPDHQTDSHQNDHQQVKIDQFNTDALLPETTRDLILKITPTTEEDYQNYAAVKLLTNDLDEEEFNLKIEFNSGS